MLATIHIFFLRTILRSYLFLKVTIFPLSHLFVSLLLLDLNLLLLLDQFDLFVEFTVV